MNFKLFLLTLFFTLIILYLITGLLNKRYYKNYPTLYLYPNNEKDVKIVEKYNNIRLKNEEINNFVKITDTNMSYAFINEIDGISINDIKNIDNNINDIIHFFKFLFNRPRPWQINLDLNHYDSKTAFSPSFPSGHSAQAQYIAKRLSEKYPEKKEKLYEVAEKCGLARVYGGLHYLSDHLFAKFIVSMIP
jgi:membrane-associated phospholipid phosphatase